MNKHRTSIALCIAGAALLCSSASWAGDPGATTTTTSSNGNGTSQTATTTTTAANYEGAPGEEKMPPPNRPLLITGGVAFAGAYIPSALVAAYSSNPDDKALWAPVAGPWINLAIRDCGATCDSGDTWNAIGLIASGLAQAGGLAVAVASFYVPEKPGDRVLASAEERKVAAAKAAKPTVQVMPVSFRAGAGIGAVGRF